MNSGTKGKVSFFDFTAGGSLPNAIHEPLSKFRNKTLLEIAPFEVNDKRMEKLIKTRDALLPKTEYQKKKAKLTSVMPDWTFQNYRKHRSHLSSDFNSEIVTLLYAADRLLGLDLKMSVQVNNWTHCSGSTRQSPAIMAVVDSEKGTITFNNDGIAGIGKDREFGLSELRAAMDFVATKLRNLSIVTQFDKCLQTMILYYNQTKHKEDPKIAPGYSIEVGDARLVSLAYPQVTIRADIGSGEMVVGKLASAEGPVHSVRKYGPKDVDDGLLYAFKIFEGINKPDCCAYWLT